MSGEFVAEPVVPIELTLTSGRCYTMYRPGWHAVEGASPFPGETGKVFVFNSLTNLQTYVDDEGIFAEARPWTLDDYSNRLCAYDLAAAPAADTRSEDDQLELGSALAVLLDLLDQLEADGPHADTLREDDNVERLASGEPLRNAADGARLREILAAHWGPCVERVSTGVVIPDLSGRRRPSLTPAGLGASGPSASGAGARSDTGGSIMLEEVASALTLWFGLTDKGAYTLRSTELADGSPTYPESATGTRRLAAWESLDRLTDDVTARKLSFDEPTLAGLEGLEVDLTPDDEDIFDLVQIGESIQRNMTVEQADTLVTAWTEVVRLAGWGNWQDVLRAAVPPTALGHFVVACAVDRAQDRLGAEHAIGSVDLDAVRTEWSALIRMAERHIDIDPDPTGSS